MPIVTGRFVSLDGKTLDQLKEQHFPRRMLENAGLSWADAPPAGDKVTQGKWWTSGDAAEMAMGEGEAQRLHLGVGSTVELEIGGAVRTLKVAALYRADGQHLGGAGHVCAAVGLAEGRAGDVVWRGAHRSQAGGGDGAGAVCGVSDRHA